ncbi:MAG TPA: hypothetical protein VN689_01830 [Burkholderiales bacterium]|nr:hypothetical protein [Burkholderiales bacterium]
MLVAAAYDAGPAAVIQYGGASPFADTRQYLAKVSALYARYCPALGRARSLDIS